MKPAVSKPTQHFVILKKIYTSSICSLSSGMGGLPPRPSCVPNPCHPGVKCMETPQGIKCGPCPQGMVGNGTYCTDVDEVFIHAAQCDTPQHTTNEVHYMHQQAKTLCWKRQQGAQDAELVLIFSGTGSASELFTLQEIIWLIIWLKYENNWASKYFCAAH